MRRRSHWNRSGCRRMWGSMVISCISIWMIQFVIETKSINEINFKIKYLNKFIQLVSFVSIRPDILLSIEQLFKLNEISPANAFAPIPTDQTNRLLRMWAGIQRIRGFVFPSKGNENDVVGSDFGLVIKTISPFLRIPLLFFRLNDSNKTTDFGRCACFAALAIEFVLLRSKIVLVSNRLFCMEYNSTVSCTRWTDVSLCVPPLRTFVHGAIVRIRSCVRTRYPRHDYTRIKLPFFIRSLILFGIFPFYVAMHKSVSCKRRSMTVVFLALISWL